MKIDVTYEVDETFLGDILVTAFDGSYGGCWYWCKPRGDWPTIKRVDEAQGEVWSSVDISEDDPQQDDGKDGDYTVGHQVISMGIARIMTHEVEIRSDLETQIRESVISGEQDIDADAADCIVQAGLWGEVVYG